VQPPDAHGQVEIGQDIVHGLVVDSPHGGQGLSYHVYLDPARAGSARPGWRIGGQLVAHLGLGQQPQEGFRALAVHVTNCPAFPERPAREMPDAYLQTDDGALVLIRYFGRIRLVPGQQSFAFVAPVFETGDARYEWLNEVQAVGKGIMAADRTHLDYEFYEVL
jgi:hypothetical protein